MKVKKLLLLGILGTLAWNMAGCGIAVNTSSNGLQIEVNGNEEQTASNEEESDSKEQTQESSDMDKEVEKIIEDLPTDVDFDDDDDDYLDEDDDYLDDDLYDDDDLDDEKDDLYEDSDLDSIGGNNAEDAIKYALDGTRSIIEAATGTEMFIYSIRNFGDTYVEEGLTVEDSVLVDLDNDGEEEAVVTLSTGYDGCYEILDFIDGTVYAHQLNFRSITSLYKEGYCLGSSGASYWDIYNFKFTSTGYTENFVAGCHDGEYYLYDETVSEEAYYEFADELTLLVR